MDNHERLLTALREGGSVLFRGRVITRPEDLPDETELSVPIEPVLLFADPAAIDAQIAALMAQRERITAGTPAAPAAPKAKAGK